MEVLYVRDTFKILDCSNNNNAWSQNNLRDFRQKVTPPPPQKKIYIHAAHTVQCFLFTELY